MSPTSNNDIKDRARLARQMLRDFPVSKPSEDYERMMSEPPPESTTSSMGFDPDNEALVSTRQIDEVSTDLDDDTSGMLVQLRESARKYKHYNPPEPAVAIDTSTIAKAFPDFSQVCHSASESYASIEAGRGYQHGDSQTEAYLAQWRDDAPRKPRNKANDSLVDMSSPKKQNHAPTNNIPRSSQQPSPKHIPEQQIKAVVDNTSLMDFTNLNLTRSTLTPPKSSQHKMETLAQMSKQDERELYPTSATDGKTRTSPTLAKTTEYGSAGSRNSSQEQRRVPSAYHARVTDEADESYVSDHRLPRNSRFASPSAKTLAPATKFKSAQGIVQTESPNISQKKNGTNNVPSLNEQFQNTQYSGAQSSYIMPSLPELSELITGTYNDGTPVFSHSSKPRASRFTGAKDGKTVVKPEHAIVDEIELPKDEQDIMMQLQLLQDRVRDLEAMRAETQIFVQEVQQENMALKQEKMESRKWRRSDSALGSTDGSDLHQDEDRGSRRSLIERTRKHPVLPPVHSLLTLLLGLEASLRLMQEQYDAEKRKTVVQDVVIKNVSQDRDAATKQLAVAFFAMEQLKNDNLRLKEENVRLESELRSKSDLITRMVQQQQAEDNLRDRFEHNNDLIHTVMEKPQPEMEKTQKQKSQKTDIVPSQKDLASPGQLRCPGLYSDKFEDTEDLIRKIMEKPLANEPATNVSVKPAKEISAKSSKEVSHNPSKEVPSKPVKEQSTAATHDDFNRTEKAIQKAQEPAKVVPSTPTKATGVKFSKKQSAAADQASHKMEEVLTRARRNSSGVRQPNFESKATQTQTNQGTFDKHSPGGTRYRDSQRREKFVLGENSFVSDNGEISICEQARQRSEERSLNSRDATINTEAVAKQQDDNDVSGAVTHLTALAVSTWLLISCLRTNLLTQLQDTDFSEMRAKIEHERIARKQRKIHPNVKMRYSVNVKEHLPTHSNNEPSPLEMHRTLSLKGSAMDGRKGLDKQTSKSQAELDEVNNGPHLLEGNANPMNRHPTQGSLRNIIVVTLKTLFLCNAINAKALVWKT